MNIDGVLCGSIIVLYFVGVVFLMWLSVGLFTRWGPLQLYIFPGTSKRERGRWRERGMRLNGKKSRGAGEVYKRYIDEGVEVKEDGTRPAECLRLQLPIYDASVIRTCCATCLHRSHMRAFLQHTHIHPHPHTHRQTHTDTHQCAAPYP